VEQAMRDFTNPYYDGPDCVCCKHIKENTIKEIIKMLEEKDSVCSDWVAELLREETQ
jgi:hypothetical protein